MTTRVLRRFLGIAAALLAMLGAVYAGGKLADYRQSRAQAKAARQHQEWRKAAAGGVAIQTSEARQEVERCLKSRDGALRRECLMQVAGRFTRRAEELRDQLLAVESHFPADQRPLSGEVARQARALGRFSQWLRATRATDWDDPAQEATRKSRIQELVGELE